MDEAGEKSEKRRDLLLAAGQGRHTWSGTRFQATVGASSGGSAGVAGRGLISYAERAHESQDGSQT